MVHHFAVGPETQVTDAADDLRFARPSGLHAETHVPDQEQPAHIPDMLLHEETRIGDLPEHAREDFLDVAKAPHFVEGILEVGVVRVGLAEPGKPGSSSRCTAARNGPGETVAGYQLRGGSKTNSGTGAGESSQSGTGSAAWSQR